MTSVTPARTALLLGFVIMKYVWRVGICRAAPHRHGRQAAERLVGTGAMGTPPDKPEECEMPRHFGGAFRIPSG